MNNDSGSLVRWFANDFHEWRNHLTRNQKNVIHGNSCIIIYNQTAITLVYSISFQQVKVKVSNLLKGHSSWMICQNKHTSICVWVLASVFALSNSNIGFTKFDGPYPYIYLSGSHQLTRRVYDLTLTLLVWSFPRKLGQNKPVDAQEYVVKMHFHDE